MDETVDFLRYVRKHGHLKKAWQSIKSNGRRSTSPYVKDDIDKFTASEDANIRSISAKIQHGSYSFSPARGIALEKPNKPGSIRPIVIPRAQDRIVHRCILNALVSDARLRSAAFRPTSFGGIPKRENEKLAGVPAAINAVIAAIKNGGSHIIVADIASFFSNIRKSQVIQKISQFSSDEKFIDLLNAAIKIDLDNHESLWRFKSSFPYDDVGVGQGVCLSPFFGNILLGSFDDEMNDGDCTCIRYVDDIIIVAPSGKAASSRLRKAERLLSTLGMSLAEDKTDRNPIPVCNKFEYLGIEFNNGLLRPSLKSRNSIVQRTKDVAAKSLQAVRSSRRLEDFNIDYSTPKTLNKISGMAKGWANHYRFCNDIETIKNIDNKIMKIFLLYSTKAHQFAEQALTNNYPELAAAFLGYSGIRGITFDPLLVD